MKRRKILIVSVNEVAAPKIYPEGCLYIAKRLEGYCDLKIYDFSVSPDLYEFSVFQN